MDCNKEEATKARGITEEMMEKDDVPEGSFELDPASLPTYQLVPYQVREPEFYKFTDERSREKFQIGQCWVIYIDEDKIDLLPEFVLHVAWFYACPLPKITIRWHDKTMPISSPEPLKKGVYKIFPRTGEVWAVYKNWSAQLMKGNNLEDVQYENVEIVDVSNNYVDVKFLALVKGFKSIYMAQMEEEEADKVVKICASEHLSFSHQIPSFRVTEERASSL
ncbi:hypothetical protein R3W88_019549 [Solanum pinnatisectum]|uniref:DUF3444 domain-containing protein n=1 Tax=Solanum pinnatisectum TaxID=50273 RepID=A0AAV9KKL5_9SOLN|nr:hypothetical protein R3W88_019549 [Solanum pinnatisectum]